MRWKRKTIKKKLKELSSIKEGEKTKGEELLLL